MKNIGVSIITVVYNNIRGIERTIQSVLNQSYNNIEYIIIDGGSTDGTLDVIKRYENRISYWISEADEGIYNAMNKGILKAHGSFLNFMNSGDTFVTSTTIERLIERYEKGDKIIYGNILKCYDRRKERTSGIVSSHPDIIDFYKNMINHQAAFISRELFEKYGLYDEKYKLASDWFFFLKVVGINQEKIRYCNIDVANFMMDGISSMMPLKYMEEQREIRKALFKGYDVLFCELAEYRQSGIIRFLIKIRMYLGSRNVGDKIRFVRSIFEGR